MTPPRPRAARRSDALTKERIVAAAVEVLDAEGEDALTFRALTTRLATGPGAIYHHVADKRELLVTATDEIISAVLTRPDGDPDPRRALRNLALGIFDAIDAHPWVGSRLSREPDQPAVQRIWAVVGRLLRALEVPPAARVAAGYALVNYILGAAAQYAAGPRTRPRAEDRTAYLEAVTAQWIQLDPAAGEEAALVRDHDDREQFLAGVDIFLAGATTLR